MKCRRCDVEKLSKEFPDEPPCDSCTHPPHYCLSCMVDFLQKDATCPSPGCSEVMAEDKLTEYKEELDYLFPKPLPINTAASTLHSLATSRSATDNFLVAMLLNGEHRNISFGRNRSVADVKAEIQHKLNAKASKQKLLYGDTVLKERTSEGSIATLGYYNIQARSTIRVLVQLCEVPVGIENAVFDLYWGYPNHGRDYLDASALFYSGKVPVCVCDYRTRPQEIQQSVYHSGDVMNDTQRQGHHTITVRFQQLPPTITTIFFVLSAWGSPTIAHFNSTALKFYDKVEPKKLLCENHVEDRPNVQAVIMCRVDKDATGSWTVFDMGTKTNGNAMNYKPIYLTLANLV